MQENQDSRAYHVPPPYANYLVLFCFSLSQFALAVFTCMPPGEWKGATAIVENNTFMLRSYARFDDHGPHVCDIYGVGTYAYQCQQKIKMNIGTG